MMASNSESLLRNAMLTSTIQVAVFHPQPIVANGLATLLSMGNGIEVTGITSRAGRLVTAVSRWSPKVVVLGLATAGLSHPDRLISRVWAASAEHKPAFVVIVSSDQDAADALAVDAMAVVTTEVTGHTLRELVLSAGDGRSRRVPAELVRPHVTSSLRDGEPVRTVLTARESDVLCGIESGLSTKEIAARLGISVNTTRTHAQRLMSKLRVHSRLQAAALAADQPHLAASGHRT